MDYRYSESSESLVEMPAYPFIKDYNSQKKVAEGSAVNPDEH